MRHHLVGILQEKIMTDTYHSNLRQFHIFKKSIEILYRFSQYLIHFPTLNVKRSSNSRKTDRDDDDDNHYNVTNMLSLTWNK